MDRILEQVLNIWHNSVYRNHCASPFHWLLMWYVWYFKERLRDAWELQGNAMYCPRQLLITHCWIRTQLRGIELWLKTEERAKYCTINSHQMFPLRFLSSFIWRYKSPGNSTHHCSSHTGHWPSDNSGNWSHHWYQFCPWTQTCSPSLPLPFTHTEKITLVNFHACSGHFMPFWAFVDMVRELVITASSYHCALHQRTKA